MSLREREQRAADKAGITQKVEAFKVDLLKISGVVDVEFDLDGFYDGMQTVIFLPKYDIPMDTFFEDQKRIIRECLETAAGHGLRWAGDRIEDYGAHLYIVTEGEWLEREEVTEQSVLATIQEFRKVQRDAFAPCPRCGHFRMATDPVRNALSRYADIYICDLCGTDEAMRDFSGKPLMLTDWAIALRVSDYLPEAK